MLVSPKDCEAATNHLIGGVVLTPGMAGTIPELQQAGFHYLKSE